MSPLLFAKKEGVRKAKLTLIFFSQKKNGVKVAPKGLWQQSIFDFFYHLNSVEKLFSFLKNFNPLILL
ncbi:MAG: hypothetical protein CME68_01140 [Halobacteriovoraceae bacterium]|nr:hypothetical protein [Halobacteriovoraceae bacterium]